MLKDPRINDLNILVIVNSPKDALFVVENATDIKKVNIGNYGKASKNGEERIKLNDNVFLGEQDKDYLREIIKLGVTTEYQLVPDQPITDMKTVL